jgi:Ser/Thr protein kinase RdoA (MazF antagonist)
VRSGKRKPVRSNVRRPNGTPAAVPFKIASYAEQVRRLRALAKEALKHYSLKPRSIMLLNHGENTTFKITDTRGKRYNLRVHRLGYHSKAGIREELKWMRTLQGIPGVQVPVPVLTRNGQAIVTLSSGDPETLDGPRQCDLLAWVGGSFKSSGFKQAHFFALGKAIATIHRKSSRVRTTRKYWHADGLLGPRPKFGSIRSLKGISSQERALLERGRKALLARLKRYERQFPERLGMIHADLHFGNILWQKSGFGIIDFDDSGHGFRMYDLAVTCWAITQRKIFARKDKKPLIAALLEGYSSTLPMDAEDREILRTLILTRELVMLGWLHSRSDNPKLVPYVKVSLKRNLKDLAAFLRG